MSVATLAAPPALDRGLRPLRACSDEQLVARFRRGEEDAFGAIHDRYRVRLLAFIRQLLPGGSSAAEDALQDVLLRAYRALRADERPVRLRSWLYAVTHNRCVDLLRQRVTAHPAAELEEHLPATDAGGRDPYLRVAHRDELRALVAGIARLPERQRSALVMRELDGRSYAEIGAAIDTSVPAVKALLVRARRGLSSTRPATR